MTMMSGEDFEAAYRSDPDPWGYTTSRYEREKYRATLTACGGGRFTRALELGSSIGVFSELLAPVCDTLITIDGAPTAVRAARERLADHGHVEPILGPIPDAIPRCSYDLVVASEILYYLSPHELDCTLAAVRDLLLPGGRLVAVHWLAAGPERPFTADAIHTKLLAESWLAGIRSATTSHYRLDVLERR